MGRTPAATSLFPPLGLLYLGAVLEQHGHIPTIIDLGREYLTDDQLRHALSTADVVGLSVYTNNYQHIAELSKKIKEIAPSIPQIIGGPHCIFLKERSLLDIPTADICCIGEGEQVFPEIFEALQGNKRLSDVSGIWFREKGTIRQGKPLQVLTDLDALPFPARQLVQKYTYPFLPGIITNKTKITTMMTSRGCPFHCKFCSRYGNIIDHYGFRKRSADNVIQELLQLNELYDAVMIVDDNFLADSKRAHTIFDSLIQHKTDIEILIIGARVDAADKALYEKMRQAHVIFISYGIESGNQDVLDFYQKKITLQQIRETLKLAHDAKLITMGYFMLGASIETRQHLENTITFACSLPLDIAMFGILNYEMGSMMWFEEVKKKKILPTEFLVRSDSRRGLGKFTVEELQQYVQQAYKRFYFRPSYLFREIFHAFLQHDIRRFHYGLRFITHI